MAERRTYHVMKIDPSKQMAGATVEWVGIVDEEVDHVIADIAWATSERIISGHPAVIQYVEATEAARQRRSTPPDMPAVCPDCENTGWVALDDERSGDCPRCV